LPFSCKTNQCTMHIDNIQCVRYRLIRLISFRFVSFRFVSFRFKSDRVVQQNRQNIGVSERASDTATRLINLMPLRFKLGGRPVIIRTLKRLDSRAQWSAAARSVA
jgi:hypothetical protein